MYTDFAAKFPGVPSFPGLGPSRPSFLDSPESNLSLLNLVGLQIPAGILPLPCKLTSTLKGEKRSRMNGAHCMFTFPQGLWHFESWLPPWLGAFRQQSSFYLFCTIFVIASCRKSIQYRLLHHDRTRKCVCLVLACILFNILIHISI